jgi:quercetin dioxygenase-like cupin family protein
MRTIVSVVTAAAILTGGAYAVVRADQAHVLQALKDTQWGPAPPFVPPGAQLAVLSGDPTKPVPYAVRIKFPANYAIPAHSHPTDENVVVASGAVTFGMGNKLTKSASNTTLSVGGYALQPAGMNHFAYTGAQEATIVLFGIGPVDFKYVDPKDDPRTATTK